MKYLIKFILSIFLIQVANAQTGVGIGIYPTGTETGFGFRSGKNSRLIADIRICKANFYSNQTQSSFTTEISGIYKLVQLEKICFHMGIGARSEWNFGDKKNKYGGVVPIGVEAFPFPFQNAGLFFEVAPFFTHNFESAYYAGIRTVAGFIFYFPLKEKEQNKN